MKDYFGNICEKKNNFDNSELKLFRGINEKLYGIAIIIQS